MEHESTKHGVAADDRLAGGEAGDVAGPTDPGGPTRLDEPAGAPDLPGEPMPPESGARPGPVDDPEEGPGERGLRRELLERLEGARFPADRNDLLRHLGPDSRDPAIGHLRSLPSEVVFDGPESVVRALAGIRGGGAPGS
jgi:hypothetical protein